MQGIDVSKHNGTVDWEKAKSAGLAFAVIRCGFGSDIQSQDDEQFARNVQECDRLGIPWGAYLYSYALDLEEAKSELAHMLRLLRGKKPQFPVYLDMEDADGYKAKHGMPSRRMLTDIIKTVCGGLRSAGFLSGYYVNLDWYNNRIYPDDLRGYEFWYARPGVEKPDLECGLWQSAFPETGGAWPGANLPGGGCDMDVGFRDYPRMVREAGLNGFAATQRARVAGTDTMIESQCVLDTTVDMERPLGACYTLLLKCPVRPTVTAGTPVVCVCPLYQNAPGVWLCNLVGYLRGTAGIYTQVPGEPACIRFRYRVV